MATRKTNIPQIPAVGGGVDPAVARVLDNVRQWVDVREGKTGTRGNAGSLERFVTLRDLIDSGIAVQIKNGKRQPIKLPSHPDIAPIDEDELDTSTPPAVTNFTVTPAIAMNILQWDPVPISNLAYYEIWRADTDDLGTAVRIGTTEAETYGDNIGATGVTKYYWIRAVSTANLPGPYNATNGTQGTTGYVQDSDTVDDTTPPGAPTGLAVTSGIRTNILTWANPGDSDVHHTEIWRHTADDRGAASKLSDAVGEIFADDDVSQGQAFYYWIRTVDTSGNIGNYNATAGTQGSVGQAQTADIADLAITNAKIGNLAVDDAKVADLSAAKLTAGTISSAVINLGGSNITLDGPNSLISVDDEQATPVTRLKLGKLGAGQQDWGLEIYDSAGSLIVGANGLGAAVVGTTQVSSIAAGKIAAGTVTAAVEMTSATITGGLIRTSSGTGRRVEIEGGTYLLWAGSGAKSDANAKLYVKDTGGAVEAVLEGTVTITGGSGIASLSDAGALVTKDSVDLSTSEVINKNLDNLSDGTDYKRLQVGLLSARPAAGTADRFYLATDGGASGNPVLFRDTGAVWEKAGTASLADALDAIADNISETASKKWAGESGADITADHSADVIFRQGTAPAHKAGRIWVDTSNGDIKRSNGTSWDVVGSIDALRLTNAPAEAGAVKNWGSLFNDGGKPENNATVGSRLGTDLVQSDGSTVVSESDLIAKFNKLTSSNISLFVDGAAIGNAYIANAAIGTANIINGAIVNAKIGDGEITNAKIANATITSAKISDLSADKITAGTITGSTLQTASSGKRFVVSTSDNEAHFYNDIGGGLEEVAQIGSPSLGGNAVAVFGTVTLGTNVIGVGGLSYNNYGVYGESTNEIGGYFKTNNGKAPLKLVGAGTSGALPGSVAVTPFGQLKWRGGGGAETTAEWLSVPGTWVKTLSDDTADSLEILTLASIFVMATTDEDGPSVRQISILDGTSNNNFHSNNATSSNLALNGTTGNDGKLNIAYDGDKLYIENRRGGTRTCRVTIFG